LAKDPGISKFRKNPAAIDDLFEIDRNSLAATLQQRQAVFCSDFNAFDDVKHGS